MVQFQTLPTFLPVGIIVNVLLLVCEKVFFQEFYFYFWFVPEEKHILPFFQRGALGAKNKTWHFRPQFFPVKCPEEFTENNAQMVTYLHIFLLHNNNCINKWEYPAAEKTWGQYSTSRINLAKSRTLIPQHGMSERELFCRNHPTETAVYEHLAI